MAKKKEMDRLTRWALEADALGMRYGDYVAKYHPAQPDPERFPKKHKDGERQCQCCGIWFQTEGKYRKYCTQACADKARHEQKQKDYRRKKIEMTGLQEENGG